MKTRRKGKINQLPVGRWPAELVTSQVTEKDGKHIWFLCYRNGEQTTVNFFPLELDVVQVPIQKTADVLGFDQENAAEHLIRFPDDARDLVGWTGFVDIEERNGRILTYARNDGEV